MIDEIRNFIVGGTPEPDATKPSFTKRELKQWLFWSFVATLFSALIGMFFITIVAAFSSLYFTYKLIAKAIGF